ncbi:MAG: hypothetical protein K0S34_433 [Bacillales bacterium]|jgi:hypothetical protein|nr:hypothetical protein [Bacillales bacterium]
MYIALLNLNLLLEGRKHHTPNKNESENISLSFLFCIKLIFNKNSSES